MNGHSDIEKKIQKTWEETLEIFNMIKGAGYSPVNPSFQEKKLEMETKFAELQILNAKQLSNSIDKFHESSEKASKRIFCLTLLIAALTVAQVIMFIITK